MLSYCDQPFAKTTEITGEHDGCLKLKVAAPPVDDKANEAIIAFLSKILGIKHRNLCISSGKSARRKTVQISGSDLNEILRVLQDQLS